MACHIINPVNPEFLDPKILGVRRATILSENASFKFYDLFLHTSTYNLSLIQNTLLASFV